MSSPITTLRAVVILLAFLLISHAGFAQQAQEAGEYTPTVGQPGKDVIWIPTPDALVEHMLKMARVGPRDFVIDLGSGDGRTVIVAAEKFRARGLGIEYNPNMVALSKRNAERAGVADKVQFVEADIFESDFSHATVIMMYLLPSLNLELRPRILELQPGTRVVSHSFDMDDWRPDDKITVEGHNAYLWIVPADVAGDWSLTVPTEAGKETWTLSLEQDFQELSGRVHIGRRSFRLLDTELEGTLFRFHFFDARNNRRDVLGRAFPDRLEGTLTRPDGTSVTWNAVPEDGREAGASSRVLQ